MSADQLAGGFSTDGIPATSGSRIRRRLHQLFAGVLSRAASRQATPAIAGRVHPASFGCDSSNLLNADRAEVGAVFASSFGALVEVARTRQDQVLLSHVGWMCSAFEAGSEVTAAQLLASFQTSLARAERARDLVLLRHLVRTQRSWVRLMEAVPQ